jgi:hypothetical protein
MRIFVNAMFGWAAAARISPLTVAGKGTKEIATFQPY